jgi:5-methylcytosine-specific restriction endonuclease McrA
MRPPGSVNTRLKSVPWPDDLATVDHLIPGHPIRGNAVAACYGCNRAKGQMLPLQFILKRLEMAS